MPYNASIPRPTDLLSVSQNDIKNNFSTANASFLIDHTAFDINTNPGYHKVVHLLPQGGVPAAVATIGELYCRQVVSQINDTALFYQTGTGLNIQMSVNVVPLAATTGYSFLPGGLLIQWGNFTTPGVAPGIMFVNFPIAFDSTGTPVNNVYSITISQFSTASLSIQKLSNTQFRVGFTTINTTAMWMAIGRAQT